MWTRKPRRDSGFFGRDGGQAIRSSPNRRAAGFIRRPRLKNGAGEETRTHPVPAGSVCDSGALPESGTAPHTIGPTRGDAHRSEISLAPNRHQLFVEVGEENANRIAHALRIFQCFPRLARNLRPVGLQLRNQRVNVRSVENQCA